MIDFSLRKYNDHAFCMLKYGSTAIDLSILDRNEAKDLLQDFQSAVDDLEWFIRVTEKAND